MKKFTVKHLLGLMIECCALVLFVLCIATDINDKLFLPLAQGCVSIGAVIVLHIHWQARKNNTQTE